jgi:hypothetical protein
MCAIGRRAHANASPTQTERLSDVPLGEQGADDVGSEVLLGADLAGNLFANGGRNLVRQLEVRVIPELARAPARA